MAYQHAKNGPAREKGKGAKLGHKMQRFVDEYLVDLVGSKAVLRAGYECKPGTENRRATELLNHPLVVAEIEKRQAIRRDKMELTAQYIVNKLVSIIEDTEKDNPQAALRALELAGKHLGMYRDRQEISGPDGNAIEMEQRVREDTADFNRRMAGLAAAGTKGGVSKLPIPGRNGGS